MNPYLSDYFFVLQVVGAMAVVRNSVGSNCYVSDEIITSRAGVRIRVGNTDAEVCTLLLNPYSLITITM